MAWITFDLTALRDRSGSVPWHIRPQEVILIPRCREMALHGELLIDGDGELRLEATARLIMQE